MGVLLAFMSVVMLVHAWLLPTPESFVRLHKLMALAYFIYILFEVVSRVKVSSININSNRVVL
jgi:hypothetical protein